MKRIFIFLFVGVLVVPATGFQKDIALKERKGAKLKGTIVDARNKEMGVAGSNVTIVGTELGGASMPNGFYMITNIPPGTWKVKVSHLSYASQEKTITVKEGEDLQLDFELELERKDRKEIFTAQKKDQDLKDTSIYFVVVENLPEPIGGINAILQNVTYPEIVRRAGIEGTAYVEVFINEDGRVDRTAIVRSAGHPALDSSAVKAVALSRFTPGTQKGKPVKVRLAIPIRFKIAKPAESPKSGKEVSVTIEVEGRSGSGDNSPVRVKTAYLSNNHNREMEFVVQKAPFEISSDGWGTYALIKVENDEDRIVVRLWITVNGVKKDYGLVSGRAVVVGGRPPLEAAGEREPYVILTAF